MNKKKIVILYLILTSFNLLGQNLIKNPSFEKYRRNIVENQPYEERIFIDNWTIPNGSTPDYYYKENVNKNFRVPDNIFGCHHPFDGEKYVGLYLFVWDGYIEQITGELETTLIKDSLYNFSIAIKFPSERFLLKVNKIEVHFSDSRKIYIDNSVSWYNKMYSKVKPKADIILPLDSVNFKNNWDTINAYYLARGDEKFLTIGLFYQSDPYLEKKIDLYQHIWPKGVRQQNRFFRRNNKYSFISNNEDYNPEYYIDKGNTCHIGIGAYYFIDKLSLVLISHIKLK